MPNISEQHALMSDRHNAAYVAAKELIRLAKDGAGSHRTAAITMEFSANWRSQGMHIDDMRERLRIMLVNIEAAAQATQACVVEAQSETAKTTALEQLDALEAARVILAMQWAQCG